MEWGCLSLVATHHHFHNILAILLLVVVGGGGFAAAFLLWLAASKRSPLLPPQPFPSKLASPPPLPPPHLSSLLISFCCGASEFDDLFWNLNTRKVREREKMRRERRSRRISRIGSYAISSSMSMRDHRQQPCITCTTFNILAPIYKRLNINNDKDQNSRESDYRAYWLVRNQRILDSLLRERSSIICLQVLLSLSLCLCLCLCLFMVLVIVWICLLIVSNWCRNFGWEMKSWSTCMRRD